MRSLSISFKLAAWYACSMLLGLAVFGVIMWFVLASSMLSWKDRTLQMRAGRVEAVLAAAQAAGRPSLSQSVVDSRLTDLFGMLPEGEWIQLMRGGWHTHLSARSFSGRHAAASVYGMFLAGPS